MNTAGIVLLIVAIAVLLALVGFLLSGYTSTRLQKRFGPEYRRVVTEAGSTRRGEARLRQAEKRVHQLRIRPLRPSERERFAESWRTVQAHFVNDPQSALAKADSLIGEVLEARGYPVVQFEQSAQDIAVDHPQVVEHYRAAHAICLAQAAGRGSTEDLRQAMIHYRALFDELISAPGEVPLRRAG